MYFIHDAVAVNFSEDKYFHDTTQTLTLRRIAMTPWLSCVIVLALPSSLPSSLEELSVLSSVLSFLDLLG